MGKDIKFVLQRKFNAWYAKHKIFKKLSVWLLLLLMTTLLGSNLNSSYQLMKNSTALSTTSNFQWKGKFVD